MPETPFYDDSIEDANKTSNTNSYLEDGNTKSYVILDSTKNGPFLDLEVLFDDIVLSDNFLYSGAIVYVYNPYGDLLGDGKIFAFDGITIGSETPPSGDVSLTIANYSGSPTSITSGCSVSLSQEFKIVNDPAEKFTGAQKARVRRITQSTAKLLWDNISRDAKSFVIAYKKSTSTSWTFVEIEDPLTTEYEMTGLDSTSTYFVKISTVFNEARTIFSDFTETITFTTK